MRSSWAITKGARGYSSEKCARAFTPALRASVFKEFQGLETDRCLFKNLPAARRGQWGEGLNAEQPEKSRSLKPRLVVTIEYLECTAANHLRLARFVGLSPLKITNYSIHVSGLIRLAFLAPGRRCRFRTYLRLRFYLFQTSATMRSRTISGSPQTTAL
jgi:hypothetical protein